MKPHYRSYPFVSLCFASERLDVSRETLRIWCHPQSAEFPQGRGIGMQRGAGTRWRISWPAARMLSFGDQQAFRMFEAGDVTDEVVASYLVDLK